MSYKTVIVFTFLFHIFKLLHALCVRLVLKHVNILNYIFVVCSCANK